MGHPFFTGWALWEKMVFCLACAIVVTFMLGCIKLAYTHWRLRKYTAVAEEKKHEQGLQRQMSLRRPLPTQDSHNEVPFGIRAIQSGIEVDGVWISRNHTPEPVPSSWESSYHAPRTPSSSDLSYLEQGPDRSDSDYSSIRYPSSNFDRLNSRDSSPDGHVTRPAAARSRYPPPPSYLRHSGNPYVTRDSVTVNTLEGIEAAYQSSIYDRNGFDRRNRSKSSSSESSTGNDDTAPISASAPNLLNDQTPPRDRSRGLDAMHSHRISQVAETGQLTPRRRPHAATSQSGDWSGVAIPTPLEPLLDPSCINPNWFVPRHSLVLSEPEAMTKTAAELPRNLHIKSSSETAPPIPPNRKLPELSSLIIPDVTTFAQFVQTAPLSPTPDSTISGRLEHQTTKPDSHWPRSNISEQRAGILVSTPSSPIATSPLTAEPPAAMSEQQKTHFANQTQPWYPQQPSPTDRRSYPPLIRQSFEKPEPQILRGHGSGFEILRPGSLTLQPSPLDLQRAAPPLPQRKLQKKRPPSLDSQHSSSRRSVASNLP